MQPASDPRYERYRLRAFAITWIVYVSYYLTRQSFSAAKVALADDPRISLTRGQLGIIDSTYLTTYSLGQFLFGPLVDRFGPRRILLGGMTLSIIAATCTGFSTTFAAFIAFAVLQGVAQATGWTSTTKVMSQWFSLRERGRVLGWWCTHYTVGNAFATPFAGWMMDAFGRTLTSAGKSALIPYWPAAYWGPAAVLTVVTLGMWIFLRNRPEDVGLPPIERYHGEPESVIDANEVRANAERQPADRSWRVVAEVLQSRSIWMFALAYFPIKLVRYSISFWGPMYVNESLGTDALASTLTAAWMPIGGVVGVVLSGYVSDKLFQSRRAPVIVLSLLALAGVLLLGQAKFDHVWAMRAFFFLIGFFLYGPDSMLAATAAIDFGTKRGAGAATGFINGVGSLGGVLGVYLPGIVTSETDWTVFFQIAYVALFLAALLILPLWRRMPPSANPSKP